MGSILRSELMSLCQLFLQPDSAFTTVAQLGELGNCHFRDVSCFALSIDYVFTLQLNTETSAYNQKFVMEVKRCDNMQRQISQLVVMIAVEHVLDLQSSLKTPPQSSN